MLTFWRVNCSHAACVNGSFASSQVAGLRTRRMFCCLWARTSQAGCVLCASRKWTGRQSGRTLLSETEQTSRFCALCGWCLSYWMGIKGAGKVQINWDHVWILYQVRSTIFCKQDQVLLRSLTDTKQYPVYVWSPIISKCSKTCGNGEWLFNICPSRWTRWTDLKAHTWFLMKVTSKPPACAGTLQLWFSCVDHQTRLGVTDLYCDASTKPPPQSESCSTSPCPPTWDQIYVFYPFLFLPKIQ